MDIVFILDASGSIEFVNFERMRNFVAAFVEEVDVERGAARIGVVVFSDSVRVGFYLDQFASRLDIIEELQSLPYLRGSTNTAGALEFVSNSMFVSDRGDRNNARNVAFLITNSQSNNREETMAEAKALKDKGIHLFVAGVGASFLYNLSLPNPCLVASMERKRL